MRSLTRKLVKFFFVFLPVLMFFPAAMLGMLLRQFYLGITGQLTADQESDIDMSRMVDMAVTIFWTWSVLKIARDGF